MRRLGVVAITALILVSCSDGTRPATVSWLNDFEAVQALLPELDAVEADPGLCAPALASLRESGKALVPTPDPSVDTVYEGWLALAESTMFECPPRSGEIVGFPDAYDELGRFESELRAGLEP